MELIRRLEERTAIGRPIAVGVIGCGQMGSGLAQAITHVNGMNVRLIADIQTERAVKAYRGMKIREDDIVITDNPSKAEDALRKNKFVATSDAVLGTCCESIEANVEATGVTDVGARVAWSSIMNRKPVIMLNVETDITVGALFDRIARKTGSVYTVASGDEPGVCKMLYEQAVLMGFEVVCLGKGKNNPVDLTMTPERCAAEALSKDMNPKILTSFIDGTKTMVEMAAVSNATGLLPDVPGMHGPRVELEDLVTRFIPKRDGGIFERRGAVDYSTGKIAPGVYAVVYSEDPRIRKDMDFITKAKGPYYLHFRPYHLCDIETPQSVAEAVLLGERTVTAKTMYSEVVCVAKRNLKAGEKVGGIGSADIFGRIYTYTDAREKMAVPLGVAPGGTVTQDIDAGQIMTEHNFSPDNTTFIYGLRKMQDSLLKMESC